MPPLTVPPPPAPPAETRPAPPTPAELRERLLEAYDWGRPLPDLPRGGRHADLRWLREAATFDPRRTRPANPFPPGGGHREAESLRTLLALPAEALPGRLKSLPLRHTGTALALWRWGQVQVREGRLQPAHRRAWEDRLMAEGPALVRGYALRHALCWALAEQDETRLAALRARTPEDMEPVLGKFQRLFGLLGGPSPVLRLWSLPGLDYRDLRLDQLGARRIWIRPAEDGPLPDLPEGTAWIVPSLAGDLDASAASLPAETSSEGQSLGQRLSAAGRTAWFAPSRAAFEALGLVWFPILVELNAAGGIQAIRMGDAAPPAR